MCDNSWFVFIIVIITWDYYTSIVVSVIPCIPALKLDLFAVKDTLCINTWNNENCVMDTLRQI